MQIAPPDGGDGDRKPGARSVAISVPRLLTAEYMMFGAPKTAPGVGSPR